jgi:magnesium-transporting ATPase (P-type)
MADIDDQAVRQAAWHARAAGDVLTDLGTGEDGLSADEVERRQQRFGANELPEEDRPGLLRIFVRQFRDPLIYVLLIAGLVSLALDNLANAAFIGAVLLINSVVGALQEGRAEASASALKAMIRVRSRVVRDGREQRIDATGLVPGDVVRLAAGDAVPADVRLVSSDGLEVDEAPLTGESTPVGKSADDEVDEDAVVSERTTMAFAGSTVMNGGATGVVCRIGGDTQVGRIAQSLASGASQPPPLVLKLRRFTRQIALFVLLAVVLLSVTQFLQGVEIERLFFLGVALAVSAIPAGLPIAITVAMALSTRRMADCNVIVRQLPAVEGLGSCTLIASDKTGTLTENTLTIRRLQLAEGEEWQVSGEGYDPDGRIHRDDEEPGGDAERSVERLVRAGALCNEAEIRFGEDDTETDGDSVDLAFLVLAAKAGTDRETLLERHPEVSTIPFSAERRFAASFNRVDDDIVAHVKGAAEAVLPMCDDVDVDALREREEALAGDGFRVLAVAAGRLEGDSGEPDEDDLKGLTFLGFAALIDPIRAEVPEAIERCRRAGVEVRMITGDHPRTGLAIARELGIAGDDAEALTGKELRELENDEDALAERIRSAPVFARVEPTQKTLIVETLQRAGELVAVTGDGVNDAPALKTAHIGVAMGREGTDVARRAASLILTDDNFASLVDGIEQGRGAYDNVRKVTWLLLATGAAEVLLFFLALFAGLPLPLTAVQLLWLNLVTNGIQDVALASERVEPDALQRKPRPPDEPIFNRRMIQQTLVSGLWIGGVAFALFYLLLEGFGLDEFQARNLVLLQMVLFENVHTFSCRSETRSAFRMPIAANRLLIAAVIAAHGVHIAAMYTPGLSGVLAIEPVPASTWGMLLGVAISVLLLDEFAKHIHRKRAG